MGDELEVLVERGGQIGVTVSEGRDDLGQHAGHHVVGESEHALDDGSGPGFDVDDVLVARLEQLGEDTSGIRSQSMGGMSNLDRRGRRHVRTGW